MFGAWVEEEVEEQPGCLGVQRSPQRSPSQGNSCATGLNGGI